MFRLKLTISIAVLLSIVLLLAGTLYWGKQHMEYYTQRSELAHDTAKAYIQLSHDAYRHFKQLVDIVVLEGDAHIEQAKHSHQRLRQSFNRLRNATNNEIIQVGEQGLPAETEELEQIDEIEKLLTEGIWAFDRILMLQRRGAEESAQTVLGRVLKLTIDEKFKPFIDIMIAEELEQAATARRQVRKLLKDLELIVVGVVILAFILALAMVVWLLRSLSKPLNQLINGARLVAKGDLAHRIELPGRNEFTYLAKNFNEMTRELEQQRRKLLNAQAELENKVTLRTCELQKTNKKLQRIDEGRLRFFADISHELRTPMTAIRGEAEVAVRGADKTADEYRDALTRIVELAQQLGKLVEDLLFMARSETADLRFEFRQLELSSLISDLCEGAGAFAQQQQHELILELPGKSVTISGDRLRLRQVLLILIDNACRYSDAGSEITVTLELEGGSAVVTVCDQGIGIPVSEQLEIFERFYRGEQARDCAPSGFGLGLPLARSIVTAHQGKIKVVSMQEQGACMRITLPVITTIIPGD